MKRIGDVFFALSLGLAIGGAIFAAAWFGKPQHQRRLISNDDTLAQVDANLDITGPAQKGQYVTGYKCLGWTAGNHHTHRGWIVIRCYR